MSLKLVGSNITSKMSKEEQKKHEDIVKSGETKYVAPKTSSKKSSKKSTGIGGVEAGTTSEERRLARKAAAEEGTIYLGGAGEKADTSIKGQIEKAKDLPFPINVLASPITTGVLGTALGGLLTFGALTGGAAGGASSVGAIGPGTLMVRGGSSALQVAKNTVTIKKSASIITKVVAQFKKPTYIVGAVGAILGTYPWAEWSQGEAREAMSLAIRDAKYSGNVEVMQQAKDAQNELWDPQLWETLARFIPGANLAVGFWNKYRGAVALKAVNDKVIDDMIIQKETGETDDEKWVRINEEKKQQELDLIDYYNSERKKLVEWELEAKENQRDDDAKYWAREREKTSKKEAEDAKIISEFWLEYRKAVQRLEADERERIADFWAQYNKNKATETTFKAFDAGKSNLNFGLL